MASSSRAKSPGKPPGKPPADPSKKSPAGAGPFPPTTARPPPREWTEEEQAERLAGYLEIPREYWPLIRVNTHIRHYSMEGVYNNGAFVAENPVDLTKDGEPRRYFRLKNGFAPTAPTHRVWLLDYDAAARVFAKATAEVLTTLAAVGDVAARVNAKHKRIKEELEALRERCAALEARLSRFER